MPRCSWTVAVASLVLLTFTSSRAYAEPVNNSPDVTIRVGLVRSFRGAKQITVRPSSSYSILRVGSTEKLVTCPDEAPTTITIAESCLAITPTGGDAVTASASVIVVPGDPSATINIDSPGLQSKQYRGKIEISQQASSLLAINVIGIEAYLPGVLVGEMPSDFPEEALKSQAIAARCYTLSARSKHRSAGYDVCDSVHCQVFDGCLRETPKITEAVTSTRGQILTYKGKIASVMYHGDCGGATQCYSDIYHSGSYPYLCSVTEPSGVTYSTWEKSYEPTDLGKKLVAAGITEADGLHKLTVTKTSASGRALEVEIAGSRSSTTVSGSRLRTILGPSVIKSTLFTIETGAEGTITFKGKGHGHGIGMSQVGAKMLAQAPFNYTYTQILDHYFPGTTISSSTCVDLSARPATSSKPPSLTKATKNPPPPLKVRVQEPKL